MLESHQPQSFWYDPNAMRGEELTMTTLEIQRVEQTLLMLHTVDEVNAVSISADANCRDCIVVTPCQDDTKLIDFLNSLLPDFVLPKYLVSIEKLPQSSAGSSLLIQLLMHLLACLKPAG